MFKNCLKCLKITINSNLENLKSWCCNLEVLKSWLAQSWFKISRLQDQDFKTSSFRESWICNPTCTFIKTVRLLRSQEYAFSELQRTLLSYGLCLINQLGCYLESVAKKIPDVIFNCDNITCLNQTYCVPF